MKLYEMKNEFVHRIPAELEEGVLYICLECDAVVHKCACGCGEKVVLPLAKEHWQLFFDGDVTLSPSIGNYQYKCKSHYFIRNNKVIWVEKATKREKDKRRKQKRKFSFLKWF